MSSDVREFREAADGLRKSAASLQRSSAALLKQAEDLEEKLRLKLQEQDFGKPDQ